MIMFREINLKGQKNLSCKLTKLLSSKCLIPIHVNSSIFHYSLGFLKIHIFFVKSSWCQCNSTQIRPSFGKFRYINGRQDHDFPIHIFFRETICLPANLTHFRPRHSFGLLKNPYFFHKFICLPFSSTSWVPQKSTFFLWNHLFASQFDTFSSTSWGPQNFTFFRKSIIFLSANLTHSLWLLKNSTQNYFANNFAGSSLVAW